VAAQTAAVKSAAKTGGVMAAAQRPSTPPETAKSGEKKIVDCSNAESNSEDERYRHMSNQTKQNILNAIRQSAKENGGKPLGEHRFVKETGINSYDWGKCWARFGDAQKEAGLVPNQFQAAHTDKFIIEKVISLTRKLGKFPTLREMTVERNTDTEFPSQGTFCRLRTKEQIAIKIIGYCKGKNDYDDVIALCQPILEKSNKDEDSNYSDGSQTIGEVYLFKSGRYYKIGKTNDTVRRGSELRIQLPETCHLIHSIKTDDSSGIEAYWHKRFETKRKNGEWFDLTTTDVKVFKRWRKII